MSYKTGKHVEIGNNVVIEENVTLGNNVHIYDNVTIQKGSSVGDSVIIGYVDREDAGEELVTEIGQGVKIRSGSVIYRGARIGNNSSIGHNAVLREKTIIGHDTYIGSLASIEGDTRVGSYVGIQTGSYITRFCDIGDYTFIGPCFSCANDRAMTHRRPGHGKNLKGFTAEKYVRIAASVTVLPGVRLGEGCIVGAGSLVTKDVSPYKLVYGVPARVIRDAPKEIAIQ